MTYHGSDRFEAPSGEPGEMVDVKCAYCGGRGTDPFECPGPHSNCSTCGGKGYNRVVTPYEKCPACDGTGRVLGRRLNCTTCKGRGVITVRQPTGRHHTRPSAEAGSARVAARSAAPSAPSSLLQAAASAPLLGAPARPPPRARPAVPMGRRSVSSVADRVAAHITNFPGVGAGEVATIFDLSPGEVEQILQRLVQARQVRQQDELYYPA
ncbi:MAG: hypothetical protein ACE5IZ_01450 [Dehalococcoidia bacterium]